MPKSHSLSKNHPMKLPVKTISIRTRYEILKDQIRKDAAKMEAIRQAELKKLGIR